MALVYRHRRLDTNKIFYIGISKDNIRPYSDGRYRNEIWNRIVKKTDYIVEIIANDISYEDAIELEIFLISLYGKLCNKTGILSNLTDGGEGTLGHKSWCKGTKGLVKPNKGSFQKGSKSWNKGMTMSDEHKKIISEANKGRKLSKEHKILLKKSTNKICLDLYTGIYYDSLIDGCEAVNIRPNTESTRISRKSKLQRFLYV
jgi:hypothetical protein